MIVLPGSRKVLVRREDVAALARRSDLPRRSRPAIGSRDGGRLDRAAEPEGGRAALHRALPPRRGGVRQALRRQLPHAPDAEARERWIAGELAAMRVPDLRLLRSAPARTLAQAAEGWLASRIDLAPNTLATHRKSIARTVSAFGQRDPASLIPAEIAEWVSSLADELAPATIGKSLGALAQPARPPGRRAEPGPLTGASGCRGACARRSSRRPPSTWSAVIAAVAPRYRLPLLVLESTAMRVSELESLTWGDARRPGRPLARRPPAGEGGPRTLGRSAARRLRRGRRPRAPRGSRDDRPRASARRAGATPRRRSTAPAEPPARPPGRRTTSATGASRCGTGRGSIGRASAHGPGSPHER